MVFVCCSGFWGRVFSYSRGVFLPSLAESLADGSRMQISLGFSWAAIVGAIVSPALGKYMDQGSPKRVILVGITLISVSYFLLGLHKPVAFLFGDWARLWRRHELHGRSGLAPYRDLWFDHWRGRAIAFAVMGASLSWHDDAPLVTALVDQYGWRVGYTFLSLNLPLAFPVVYLFLVDRPGDIGEVRDGRQYVSRSQDEQVVIEEDHRVWTWQELLKARLFGVSGSFSGRWCVSLLL